MLTTEDIKVIVLASLHDEHFISLDFKLILEFLLKDLV